MAQPLRLPDANLNPGHEPPSVVRDADRGIDPTDVRQASPRRMNLRVLVTSLVALAILGAVMLIVFSRSTPPGLGGVLPGPAPTTPAAVPAPPPAPAPAQ